MGTTSYPDGVDDFSVTSLPEETPLSSAGPGATRSHPELHDDINSAVEALQTHAAQKTHDHSGVSTDSKKGNKLAQANTHQSPDTDTSTAALHHTLGEGQYQAARGTHLHDYNDGSRLLNRPWVICTSSTRPAQPYPGLQIYETDTNRVRVWSTFGSTVGVVGINSTEQFNTGASPALPSSRWSVSYDSGDLVNGQIGTPDGNNLSWTDQGYQTNRAIARRIYGPDAVTATDDQVISWSTGDVLIEEELIFTDGATNDKYFRMSADGNSYVRLRVGNDYVKWFYTTTGKANEKHLGTLDDIETELVNMEWRAEIENRTFRLYRGGELLGSVIDTKAVTNKGTNFRGWGVGMAAGQRGFGQTTPANEKWVRIQDRVYYVAANRWTVLPVAKIPVVRLLQTTTQQLVNTGTLIQWGAESEDEFDYWTSSSPTDILIREPGLYDIHAAVQWNPNSCPDQAYLIMCINGIETTLRKQQFMRGQLFQPGFSQTVDLSGQLRFNTNDILTVKVKYVASGGLLSHIFSFFEAPSKINSRIDLSYVRV